MEKKLKQEQGNERNVPKIEYVYAEIDNFITGLSPDVSPNFSKSITFQEFVNVSPNLKLGSATNPHNISEINNVYLDQGTTARFFDLLYFDGKIYSILGQSDYKIKVLDEFGNNLIKDINHTVVVSLYNGSVRNFNNSNLVNHFLDEERRNSVGSYIDFFMYYTLTTNNPFPNNSFSQYKYVAIQPNVQNDNTFIPLGRIYEWEYFTINLNNTTYHVYVFTTDGNFFYIPFYHLRFASGGFSSWKFYFFTENPFINLFSPNLVEGHTGNHIPNFAYFSSFKTTNSIRLYPIGGKFPHFIVQKFNKKEFFFEKENFRNLPSGVNINKNTIDGFYCFSGYYFPGISYVFPYNRTFYGSLKTNEKVGYVSFLITFIKSDGSEIIPYQFYQAEVERNSFPFIDGSSNPAKYVLLNVVLPSQYLPYDVSKFRIYIAKVSNDEKDKTPDKIPLGNFIFFGEYDIETGSSFIFNDKDLQPFVGRVFYTPYWAGVMFNPDVYITQNEYRIGFPWRFFRNIFSIVIDYFPSGANTLAQNLNLPANWTLEYISDIHQISSVEDNFKFKFRENYTNDFSNAGTRSWSYSLSGGTYTFYNLDRKFIKNKFIVLYKKATSVSNSRLNVFLVDENRDVIWYSNVGITPQWDVFVEGNIINIFGQSGKIQGIKTIGDEQLAVVYNEKSFLIDLTDINIPITSRVVSKNRGVISEVGIGTNYGNLALLNTPYGFVVANASGIYITDFKNSENLIDPIKSLYYLHNPNNLFVFYNNNLDELVVRLNTQYFYIYNFKYKNWHRILRSSEDSAFANYYFNNLGQFIIYTDRRFYSFVKNAGIQGQGVIITNDIDFGLPNFWKKLQKLTISGNVAIDNSITVSIINDSGAEVFSRNFTFNDFIQGRLTIFLPNLYFRKIKIKIITDSSKSFQIDSIIVKAILKTDRVLL